MKRRILGLAAALVFAAGGGQAVAATTVGQSPPSAGTPTLNCATPAGRVYDFIQLSNTSGNSYRVPAGGGVITSWQSSLSSGSALLKLRIFNEAGTTFTPVAESSAQSLAAPQGQSSFPTRISVAGGELLGYSISDSDSMGCVYETAAAGDKLGASEAKAIGQSETPDSVGGKLVNLSVTLEADADKDGFGDESQDGCPTNPSTQAACPNPTDTTPPQTTITKQPAAKTRSKQARFEFTSPEPGSTFECSFDGAPFTACLSPILKTVGRGTHIFKVRAKDAAGNVDLSPATVEWKVKKKRKRR